MEYKIYVFNDLPTAQFVLTKINQMAASYWSQVFHYTLKDGQLVGKKNGVDNPNAALTTVWSTIETSPDGRFYFSSLSNDKRFPNGTAALKNAGLPINEITFPEEWEPDADSI